MLLPLFLSRGCPQWGFAFSAISSQVHLSFLVFITVKGPVACQLKTTICPWFSDIWRSKALEQTEDKALHLLDGRPSYSLLIC